jgi:hypothetical protein
VSLFDIVGDLFKDPKNIGNAAKEVTAVDPAAELKAQLDARKRQVDEAGDRLLAEQEKRLDEANRSIGSIDLQAGDGWRNPRKRW